MAFIESVNILVPRSWNISHIINSSSYVFEDGSIRIDIPNGIYGDTPYTLQQGQCEQYGEYIHVTPNYLIKGFMEDEFGPLGKLFVQLWAKYRFGVFEEHGYPGDEIFPLLIMEEREGWPEDGQNYCTDRPLKGILV